MAIIGDAKLTIGPILFHWPAQQKRDFYLRIADEVPVDRVYIGEVVCGKRAPYFDEHYEEVIRRLEAADIEVVHATLSEVMIDKDRQIVEGVCSGDTMVEANDASALWHLTGRAHAIGPLLNVYNEVTMARLAANGAVHITLPAEIPGDTMGVLADRAREIDVTLEAQVYGRMSLALSARCYHARAHNRDKDNCQLVCEEDPDGLALNTLRGEPFLAINGVQTLSYTCLNLMQELGDMQDAGIDAFRLSPHDHDMGAVVQLFRGVLDGDLEATEACTKLGEIGLDAPFSNGFYHRSDGYRWVGGTAA